MNELSHWALLTIEWLAGIFLVVIGVLALALVVLFLVDRAQTANAVRRNYPVIGRFRRLFQILGEFFRQYFFAFDRQELPFNRAERVWVYRAALDVDNTRGFGTTRNLQQEGNPFFINSAFPAQATDAVEPAPIVIGPHARQPYSHAAFFNVSAMSYGSISAPAVRALSRGAAKAGIWLDTGEGGLSPYHLEGGCDLVFEIGTAKYGVCGPGHTLDEDRLRAICAHPEVKMVSIKLSQGAKPGKGGLLPAVKVTPEIAAIRGIPAGMDSISPNRHVEIGNVEELLDFIARVRDISGRPTGFKAVLGDLDWIAELCNAIHRRGIESAPDFIVLDGSEGGTGAAPQTLMEGVGLPLRESLPQLVDVLVAHGLRQRVKVICAGKCITAYEVAWAMSMGADFVNSARGFMFALGCIQSLRCNRNTCPTGVTTHNPRLQRGLVVADKAERVAHYARNVMHEVGVIAHSCGLDDPRRLQRRHCRMVGNEGISIRMDELYPYPVSGTGDGKTGTGDQGAGTGQARVAP
ncbi:MAG TPA: FMN-binding glutamate synthase family protein [Rhodanobacteraceae bacterium]|nr:FMN-binding glutamate synthase family protein [Rhodanobacteraceae bacterium]